MNSLFINHAQAHEQESESGIEATLHIDPADHPIVGKEANFYFSFQDSENSFDLARCDCKIAIEKDGQQIDEQQAKINDVGLSTVGTRPLYSKTFDVAGNYKLHFSGAPKDGAKFEPFELNYNVEVIQNGMSGTEHHSMAPSQHIGHIIIFGGGLVAAIALLIRNYYQIHKQKLAAKNSAASSTEKINK